MVPVNGIMLTNFRYFVTLGKGQFKVKFKIKSEKHIYIIPSNHSYNKNNNNKSNNKVSRKITIFVNKEKKIYYVTLFLCL